MSENIYKNRFDSSIRRRSLFIFNEKFDLALVLSVTDKFAKCGMGTLNKHTQNLEVKIVINKLHQIRKGPIQRAYGNTQQQDEPNTGHQSQSDDGIGVKLPAGKT